MKVVNKELFLGAALAQIVESVGFECMRKASATIGHYEVNETRRLLIRHTRSKRGPWYFTLRPRDLRLIQDELASEKTFFVGLVCGDAATCLLTSDQLSQVLDVEARQAQSIRVHTRPRASLNVSGSGGELDGKIMYSAFPGGMFR